MTSKAYNLLETAITFKNTGGTVVFTPDSTASDAGAQSAQHDFGTPARATLFNWRAYAQMQTTPVVGEIIEVYLKFADGATADDIDNDDGTGDIAVSSIDKLKNLTYIGEIIIDEASTTPVFSASGQVEIYHQFVNIVFWNKTADQISTTAADTGFVLIPTPFQGQDT